MSLRWASRPFGQVCHIAMQGSVPRSQAARRHRRPRRGEREVAAGGGWRRDQLQVPNVFVFWRSKKSHPISQLDRPIGRRQSDRGAVKSRNGLDFHSQYMALKKRVIRRQEKTRVPRQQFILQPDQMGRRRPVVTRMITGPHFRD